MPQPSQEKNKTSGPRSGQVNKQVVDSPRAKYKSKRQRTAEKVTEQQKQDKPKKEHGHPAKVWPLAGLTVAISIAGWHALSRVMGGEQLSSLVGEVFDLAYALVAIGVFCAFFALFALFIKRRWMVFLIGLLASLAPLIFFSVSPLILVVPLILFLGTILYSHQMHYEAKTRIKFSSVQSVNHGLKVFVLFLILAITIVYYVNTTALYRERGEEALGAMIDSAVNTTNKVLPLKFAGYDPEKTVDDFMFDNMMRLTADLEEGMPFSEEPAEEEQLDQMLDELRSAIEKGEVVEQDLPEEVKQALAGGAVNAADIKEQLFEEVFREQIAKSRNDLAERLGVEVSGDEPMSQVISKIIRKYALEYLGPYQKYITPIMSLSLLFMLYALSPIFRLIILLFSAILFSLFKVSKFVKVEKVKKEVDVLEL